MVCEGLQFRMMRQKVGHKRMRLGILKAGGKKYECEGKKGIYSTPWPDQLNFLKINRVVVRNAAL